MSNVGGVFGIPAGVVGRTNIVSPGATFHLGAVVKLRTEVQGSFTKGTSRFDDEWEERILVVINVLVLSTLRIFCV